MKRRRGPGMLRLKIFAIFLLSISITPLASGAHASRDQPLLPGLWLVSFAISCKAEVRSRFESGVAELHSFQYAAAEKAFHDVSDADPRCAMAYWGLAMSAYHQLWEGADEKAVRKGHEYLETARKIGGADERERAYIAALGIVLSGGGGASDGESSRYSQSAGQISQ